MRVAAQPVGARAVVARVIAGVLAATTLTTWAGQASAYPDGPAARCEPAGRPFAPAALAIDGVLPTARVKARGQDAQGVPRPPPLTERGKWELAWDRAAGVRPGDAAGVVRLTAHTYPRQHPYGGPAPALGNLLLDRLRPGARIRVTGPDGARRCYRVTRRQRVRANASLSGFYDTAGAPRLAILVCSGHRRGPGDWSHRTIWWAQPAHPAA